jgi:hypothetical protein
MILLNLTGSTTGFHNISSRCTSQLLKQVLIPGFHSRKKQLAPGLLSHVISAIDGLSHSALFTHTGMQPYKPEPFCGKAHQV